MALIIIVVLLVFGVGLIGNIFTSLNPFIDKLGSVVNYNTAYYSAQMSAERGLLALRYHDAGFEGVSGIKTGNNSDSLGTSTQFGRLTRPTSNSYWEITSRVSKIPETGKGDVETLYAAADSKNFNTLGYNETIYIPLYIDDTTNTGDYYKKYTQIKSVFDAIDAGLIGEFRLPPKVYNTFKTGGAEALLNDGSLSTNQETADIDDDQIYDDVIIQWGLQGYVDGEKFAIQPTIKSNFNAHFPEYNIDNAFRESDINYAIGNNNNFDTIGLGFSPFSEIPHGEDIGKHNALPLNSPVANTPFSLIFQEKDNEYTGLTFSFAITNLMKTPVGQIYPFLERQLAPNISVEMPDRFFTLDAVGTVNNYTVHFVIKKPVKENSNISNFTIIF